MMTFFAALLVANGFFVYLNVRHGYYRHAAWSVLAAVACLFALRGLL